MIPNLNPCLSIEQNFMLKKDKGHLPIDDTRFQRLVSQLTYLTLIHPNITYVVSMESQLMHALQTTHFEATYRILWYLKSSHEKGLLCVEHGVL